MGENTLAEIVELNGLWDGQEIEWGVMKAYETIGFEHPLKPERSERRPGLLPARSRSRGKQ